MARTLSKKLTFKQRMPLSGTARGVAIDDKTLAAVMGSEDKPFPVLERLVHVPVFAADGTIQWQRGYVPEMKAYLDPDDIEYLSVPEAPSEKQIAEAVWWIEEAIKDFPFTDHFDGADPLPVKDGASNAAGYREPNWSRGISSRAHVIAMIGQHFFRDMIDGPCPFYLIDKCRPGEGAGYLANVAAIICEGRPAHAQPLSEKKDEVQKVILATAMKRVSFNFFDNINHKMDSGPLAGAATTGVYTDRQLGVSAAPAVPMRGIWCFAGVNVEMTGELMRRMVPIRLDAATPHPERRPPETFDHYPHQDWLLENRRELVRAFHVIGRNWVAKGRPKGARRMASFDHYAAAMSGILEAAGIPWFLDNVENYMTRRTDGKDEDGETVVLELYKRHHLGAFGADEVLAVLDDQGEEIELPFQVNKDYRVLRKNAVKWIRAKTRLTFEIDRADTNPDTNAKHTKTHAATHMGGCPTRVKLIQTRNRNPVRFAFLPVID